MRSTIEAKENENNDREEKEVFERQMRQIQLCKMYRKAGYSAAKARNAAGMLPSE